MNKIRRSLHRIFRISYWLIPAVILYIVFRRIDFPQLKLAFGRSKPWLVTIGIAYYPLVVMLGAWRWRVLLTDYVGTVSNRFVLKHYWSGLALGYFVPGSIGWDAYRLAVAGRRYGHFAMNVVIIVIEKLSALVCCIAIIMLLSPAVPMSTRAGVNRILHSAYLLVACLLVGIAATLVLYRNRDLLYRAETGLAILLNKFFARFNAGKANIPAIPLKGMIEPLISGKCLMPVLALSLAIQLLGGLANQIFFLAIGYKISVVANLFIAPVLFLVFSLPISFGSLGVREGAYILLYGLWGVPAEIALLVSFFNLVGVLLNNAVGGMVILFSSGKAEEIMAAGPKS